MAASGSEDDWELCNDDGFVYKRKKRRRLDNQPSSSHPSPPPPDPRAAELQQRERRRRTLLKLRDKYQAEIRQWELLSNSLRAMELKSQLRKEEGEEEEQRRKHVQGRAASSLLSAPSTSWEEDLGERDSRSLVDQLLLQAESQDSIISDVSNLCDVVETMCDAQENRLKQYILDLPIWGSPRELMAALCDD